MTIAAAFTAGDSDFLTVGRNGVFYDRKGQDWDATIVRILEHPISIRQGFWAPYKRLARLIGEQMQKIAAARSRAAEDRAALQAISATEKMAAGKPVPPPPPPFDVAKFAGIFAAIGLAIGAIGTMLAAVLTGILEARLVADPDRHRGDHAGDLSPSVLLAWLKAPAAEPGPDPRRQRVGGQRARKDQHPVRNLADRRRPAAGERGAVARRPVRGEEKSVETVPGSRRASRRRAGAMASGVLCAVVREVMVPGAVHARSNSGDFRTSCSASDASSSRRPASSAFTHLRGIAESPYRAPAIAPAIAPAVSASPPVHRLHEAILEPRGEEGVENRPQRVRHVGGRLAVVPLEAELRVPRGQFFRRRPQAREGACGRRPRWISLPTATHAASDSGWWCVMCACSTARRGEGLLVPEGVERHGGHAHRRAVPGVPFVRRRRKAPRLDVLQDPAPAGGAHVGRLPESQWANRSAIAARFHSLAWTIPRATQSVISVSSVTWPGRRLGHPPPVISR